MLPSDVKLSLVRVSVLILISRSLILVRADGANRASQKTFFPGEREADEEPEEAKVEAKAKRSSSSKLDSFKTRNERLNLNQADEGGIYLVGLFDVHQQHPRLANKCGPINADPGELHSRRPMQNMEAFLWAIREVNEDKSILPGVKLGSLVIDTCSSLLRTNQQFSRLLHNPDRELLMPQVRQIGAVIADNADWPSVESVASMASSLGLTTFVTQSRSSRLSEMSQKYAQTVSRASFPSEPERAAGKQPLVDTRLLEELLGLGVGRPLGTGVGVSEVAASEEELAEPDQPHSLYMIRMLLGNELLAESLAALLHRMAWDLVSVIYDGAEADMVDLHDELAKQLFSRNVQLAADEQLSPGASSDDYEKLLKSLARKRSMGSRVVICLLGTGSARQLLESLNRLRSAAAAAQDRKSAELAEEVRAINSLLWITIADREPYYSFASDALGTLTVSNSVSLIPEFKQYYDELRNVEERRENRQPAENNGRPEEPSNRWWPEYIRAVLARQQRDIELVANECAKWSEPRRSPLNEQCRSLSLSSLVRAERAIVGGRKPNSTGRAASQPRLAKYLAGGWEHNGMDVINGVLAAANGLESIRQALCPEAQVGLCEKFRLLMEGGQARAAELNLERLPMLSELLYNELLRSNFQLADGRVFNLLQEQTAPSDPGRAPSSLQHLEGPLKLYNLRYLQANSIGFVKFGQFDQQEGLEVTLGKAKFYPARSASNRSIQAEEPIESVKSTCEDENKCFLSSNSLASSSDNHNNNSSPANKQPAVISEEELALGVNSLFKLDHPSLLSALAREASPSDQQQAKQTRAEQPTSGRDKKQEEESHIYTIRSQLNHFHQRSFNASQGISTANSSGLARRTLNAIVLLPLHRRGFRPGECSRELDLEHSFQQLAALAYSQQRLNSREGQQIELTTTVIDYCEQAELAKSSLSALLSGRPAGANGTAPARFSSLIDFDGSLKGLIEGGGGEMLQVSIGTSEPDEKRLQGDVAAAGAAESLSNGNTKHLRLSLLPSKANEIEALLNLISAMPKWKLLHLIYTDHHHYRDEFVRQANKLGICVSRLIWIPKPAALTSGQVSKTKQFFQRVLHDYSQDYKASGRAEFPPTPNQEDESQGLNSTRILVVLASSSEETNRLILEAATSSMLKDYVWLTSHEWIDSVERYAAERNSPPEVGESSLPRSLLSTQIETYESYHFKQWFSELTPSLHRPLPTDLFDQFWQQHFSCSLPISAQNKTGRPCNPNQRLQMGSIREDDKVHYAIQTLEALVETFGAGETKDSPAKLFRSKFDELTRLKAGPNSPLSKYPYGFDILHRLPPAPADQPSGGGTRRENTRNMAATSGLEQALGTIVKVGRWRAGRLLLTGLLNESQPKPNHLTNFTGSDAEEERSEEAEAIRQSLSRLSRVKSACRPTDSCSRSCELQLQQTLAIISREDSLEKQSKSTQEEPIASFLNRRLHFKPAELEAAFTHPTFDEPDEEQEGEGEGVLKPSRFDSGEESSLPEARPDVQASASSMFDAATRRQVGEQIELDLRRAFASRSQVSRPLPPVQTVAVVLSAVSLLGIILIILSMTYLYPVKSSQFERSQADNLSCSSFNSFYSGSYPQSGSTNKLLSKQHNQRYLLSRQTSNGAYYLANLNDYFLLIGLLMVYSINITFLLPAATISICWFRRVGLASSYTIIFSSILVKVLRNWRQLLTAERSLLLTATRSSMMLHQQQVSIPDPIEESVEVTFESLSNDQMNNIIDENPDAQATGSGAYESAGTLSNGYQTSAGSPSTSACGSSLSGSAAAAQRTQYGSSSLSGGLKSAPEVEADGRAARLINSHCKSSTLLALSIGLLLLQFVILVVWFLEQPPEPTLLLNCWHCFSLRRSPLLFHYESLLSLLYPSAILLAGWSLSLLLLRAARTTEKRLRPLGKGSHFLLAEFESKRKQLKSILQDASSFVVTTSLLIFVWSLLTLSTISANSTKLQAPAATTASQQPQGQLESNSNDIYLVYANITSCAIIFSLLFLAKSSLIQSCAGKHSSSPNSTYLLSSAPKKSLAGKPAGLKPDQAHNSSSFSTSSSAGCSQTRTQTRGFQQQTQTFAPKEAL